MNKTASKFLAIFLTLAMLFSLATLALAHDEFDVEPHDECVEEALEEEVSVQATCKHNWVQNEPYYVRHAGDYLSSTECRAVLRKVAECTLCHAKVPADFYVVMPHRVFIDSATCTGTVQTWHKSCYYCGGLKTTETHPCPGASHVGSKCLWLPI